MPSKEISFEEALAWFQKTVFVNSPPCFLSHWKTNKKFFLKNDVLIAYEETKSHLIIAGEPAAVEALSTESTLKEFRGFAAAKNKNICGYYVGEAWAEEIELYKVQLGTSTHIQLDNFDLKASSSKEVRRALRKGLELEYVVSAVMQKKRAGHKGLSDLIKQWSNSKLLIELKFILSPPKAEGPVSEVEKWFIVEKGGEVLAFCSLLPYAREGGKAYYVDNLVHNPGRDSHALSFLMSSIIIDLKSEGVTGLNLGLNPFAKVIGGGMMRIFFRALYKSPVVYKPEGLHFFKTKFSGAEENEYCFFQSKRGSLIALVDMARVSFSKRFRA